MKCCGYDRTTRFCSQCGKKLEWEPVKIMLTYRRERVRELERKLKHCTDERGRLRPEATLIQNKIDAHQSCIDYLENLKENNG